MKKLLKFLPAFLYLAIAPLAWATGPTASGVQQSGDVVAGHGSIWVGKLLLGDAGFPYAGFPPAGIANSTGSAWGTSYTVSGTGSVLATAASPTFTGTVTLPAGQIVNGVTLTTGGSTSSFLNANGSYSSLTNAVTSVFGRTGVVTAQSGDYTTAQVTESGNLYFTNARAIASALTGYVSGAGIISATDSILSAIQKLNGNIASLVTGVSSFKSRTGAVVPASGDYSVGQVTGAAPVASPTFTGTVTLPAGQVVNGVTLTTGGSTSSFLNANGSYSAPINAVTSVFGRTGAVVAQSGDYTTAQVTESGNLYFTNARAIASSLTGYVSGAGVISATDSILSAIQKLNGNVGSLVTGVSSFNSRIGDVVPASDDYSVGQVTGAAPLASPTFTGTVTAASVNLSNQLSLIYSGPAMLYSNTGAATDNRNWITAAAPTAFRLYAMNDAGSASTSVMDVTRSGTTISSIAFSVGTTPGTEKMRITATGVGIGTATPLAVLNPYQSNVVSNITSTPGIKITSNGTSSAFDIGLANAGATFGNVAYIQGTNVTPAAASIAINPYGGNVAVGTGGTSANLGVGTTIWGSGARLAVNGASAFGTYGATAVGPPNNGMIVSGTTGIGTSSPVAVLDVGGKINIFGYQAINIPQVDNTSIAVGNLSFNAQSAGALSNTGIGWRTGLATTSGGFNLFAGSLAGNTNTTGQDNVFIGYEAGFDSKTGAFSTYVGDRAGEFVVATGSAQNTAIGASAMTGNTDGVSSTGTANTAVGYNALASFTSATKSSGIGYAALADITTGSNNTTLGYNTGRGITTGSSNTIIGASVTGLAPGLSNNIIIADGAGNQRINVGTSGFVGIGTTTPFTALDVNGTARANLFSGSGASLTGIGTTNMSTVTGTANSTTFLRGDNTWGTASGAGGSGTAGQVAYYQSTGTTSIGTSSLTLNGTNLTVAGSIAPSQTGGIVGTTTNNSANAGSVGEYQPYFTVSSSAISLTNTTATNIASGSFTAGDWDICYTLFNLPANTTVLQIWETGLSTTTGTTPGSNDFSTSLNSPFLTGNGSTLIYTNHNCTRMSFATTTTVYAVGRATFTISTDTAWGGLWGRRRR